MNTIQRYYQNQILDKDLLEALDDATNEWRKGKNKISLCEYLGMCKPEYDLWVTKPSKFMTLIRAQKNSTPSGFDND